MTNITRKRVQFTVDKGTAASAEYIMDRAGISSSDLISMVYAQIANTGKIPVELKATDDDLAKANIIRASYDMPKTKLDNDQAINDFFNDDGGY